MRRGAWDSWLSLKIKVDGLSVVWPKNQWDGFLWFGLETSGDGFLQFGLKTGGDGFLRFGERCCEACGFEWQEFRLLEKLNSQLSSELGSCCLGDCPGGVCDPDDARQRDPR
jgi:hypothetical protein